MHSSKRVSHTASNSSATISGAAPPKVASRQSCYGDLFEVISVFKEAFGPVSKPFNKKPKNASTLSDPHVPYQEVDLLFRMITEAKELSRLPDAGDLSPAGSEVILQNMFILHSLVMKMKDFLLHEEYVLAALYDVLQEHIWYRIKDYLHEIATKSKKGFKHCLVFYCKEIGKPFYLYTNDGLTSAYDPEDDSSANPTPHFCSKHMGIGLALQKQNKHTIGRLYGQILPEVYWNLENRKSPDHYRSSLQVFWKQWSALILAELTPFLKGSNLNSCDGALLFSGEILTSYMSLRKLDLSLALKLRDLSHPVSPENMVSQCLVLCTTSKENPNETKILNVVDDKRLQLMRDHSYFSLGQSVITPTLLECVIRCTSLENAADLPSYGSLIFVSPEIRSIFASVSRQMYGHLNHKE